MLGQGDDLAVIPGLEPVLRGSSAKFVNRQIARTFGAEPRQFTEDPAAILPLAETWCDRHDKHLHITRVAGGDFAWIVFISDRLDLRGADVVFSQDPTFAEAVARTLLHATNHWPHKP